jgi:simple sugar transport system permease protein
LSLRLQIFGFPSYLVLAVPYAVALAALFALSWRSRTKLFRETAETMRRALTTPSTPGVGQNGPQS